jgi:hypothetical protein
MLAHEKQKVAEYGKCNCHIRYLVKSVQSFGHQATMPFEIGQIFWQQPYENILHDRRRVLYGRYG